MSICSLSFTAEACCRAVSPAGDPPEACGKMPQWVQGVDVCSVKPFL